METLTKREILRREFDELISIYKIPIKSKLIKHFPNEKNYTLGKLAEEICMGLPIIKNKYEEYLISLK